MRSSPVRGALLVLGLAGCSTGSGRLLVRVPRQPGLPRSAVVVGVLPLDPQALLDSLARAAPTPQPRFPELEAEMADFRAAAPAADASAEDQAAIRAWRATRDSVQALADSLRRLDRASLAYREAYDRLRALYDHLGQRTQAAERARRGLLSKERELALRAARAADSLRRWEATAYASLPDRLARAVRAAGRDPVERTTDSTGSAWFTLPPGRWWVAVRLPEPDNPFMERHWNLPVVVTPWVPAVVPLLPSTARRRWRH